MKNFTKLLVILLFNSGTLALAQEKGFQEQENPVIEEIIDVGSFDKIVMVGGGNVFISQSSDLRLKVVSQDACLQSVSTTVTSNTLKINNSSTSNCKTDIYIDMPVLKEIQQNGGGDIKVDEGFDTIDSFRGVLNGGGSINMPTLKVDSFFATINGGGTLLIHANKHLKADIKGGGLISYQGNPEVVSDISGGGSVKRH
jgi:hypothetical protein